MTISCTSKSRKQKEEETNRVSFITDRNVYDDIDLFIMRGINKIETPNSYPYIKVDSLENAKRIIYKISGKDSAERIYTKEDKYWTTSYEFKGDTGYTAIYEYITPEKIIELDYEGTYKKTGYYLHDASLIEKDKMITYGFYGDKGIDVSPHPYNFEVVRKKAKAIFTERIYSSHDMFSISSEYFDKTRNKIFYSDSSCYKINNHSWFWWRYFASDKKINCK
jgi:hypothetical protein